ncbi:MAG: BMC domain-containing protein [Chloroflexi bacterium]|nr:BMC domain-containing protein [Chloroflexota bacterium]
MAKSIGVVECNCYSDVVAAADRMVKAANIHLARQEQIGDAQVALIFEGDTDEVTRAAEAAKKTAPETLKATVIANTSSRVLSVFRL